MVEPNPQRYNQVKNKIMAGGRPTKYTEELAKSILEKTSTSSKSLKTIANELNIGVRTILDWLADNKEFSQKYARAKEEQADFLAEEMMDIADYTDKDTKTIKDQFGNEKEVEDSEWVNRSKLRIETRKWIASKLKPKKYGDKTETTIISEKPIFNGIDLDVPKDNSPGEDS